MTHAGAVQHYRVTAERAGIAGFADSEPQRQGLTRSQPATEGAAGRRILPVSSSPRRYVVRIGRLIRPSQPIEKPTA